MKATMIFARGDLCLTAGMLLALVSLFAGCGAAQSKRERPGAPVAQEPEPTSSEWLYATGSARGGRDQECSATLQLIKSEAEVCKHSLCRHGANLAKDWLAVCEARAPHQAPTVKESLTAIERRKSESDSECEDQAEQFLREGCTRGEECRTLFQTWATRCGADYASPLVKRMLEVKLARTLKQRTVELDTRGCDEILTELGKRKCPDADACAKAGEELVMFRARCRAEGQPVPAGEAALELDILRAAGLRTSALPVMQDQLPTPVVGLRIASGTGTVLGLGGARTTTAQAYGTELAKLQNVEEVSLALLFPGTDSAFELRLGVLDAPDARTFYGRYPALRVEGQYEASDRAPITMIEGELEEVMTNSASGDHQLTISKLITILSHTDLLERSPALRRSITAADSQIVATLEWLGTQKQSVLHATRHSEVFVPAARRAIHMPFADVSENGDVQFGVVTRAAMADATALMPNAAAAYRRALASTFEAATSEDFPAESEAELVNDVARHAARCQELVVTRDAARKHLLDCGFGFEKCTADSIEQSEEQLDRALQAIDNARLDLTLALALVEDSTRQRSLVERCLAR